jgi:hypothetical protein
MDHHARAIVGAMKKKWVPHKGLKCPDFKYRIIDAKKVRDGEYDLAVEVKFHTLSFFQKIKYFFTVPVTKMETDAKVSIAMSKEPRDIYKMFGVDKFYVKIAKIKF